MKYFCAAFETPPSTKPFFINKSLQRVMDYSKLKVAELKDLLTARSLPVYGKKEDLIARLTESDAKKHTAADDLGDLAPPEEEYDWDAPTTKT